MATLREFRARLGLKQGDLADKLGISRSAWSTYENGRNPPLAVVKRIQRVFGEKETADVVHSLVDDMPMAQAEGLVPIYEKQPVGDEDPVADYYIIPPPKLADCDLGYISTGDAMAPMIKSGDIVLTKSVSKDEIILGDVYMVRLRSGIYICRRIMPHPSPDLVGLSTLETGGVTTPMDLGSITHAWRVSAVIRSY
jgi:transcriptional regulator with XRE-family HTH domain